MILNDLKRTFLHYRFPLAVILIFLMWDINSQRFQMADDVLFLFINVRGRSITPLMAMVITSIVYVTSYCEDYENHFLRYCLLRTDLKSYVISKLGICFLTSFCVMLLGTVLFIWRKSLLLPVAAVNSISIDNFKPVSCFGWLLPSHTLAYILIQIILDGLCCGSMSIMSLALSTFVKNSHAVIMLPCMLYFCFYYFFTNILQAPDMLSVESIYNSCTTTYTGCSALLLFYAIFITLLFSATAYLIMFQKIKVDYI